MKTLRVATVNDDWGTKGSNIKGVAPFADVILTQEDKNTNVSKHLTNKWAVVQVRRSQSTAGSAIAYRKKLVIPGRAGQTLGVLPRGAKMLPRRITWLRCRVYGKGVLLVATHRPPIRYRFLWRFFDAHLAARVRLARKRLVIVGLDANHRNPQHLAKVCGLTWHAPDDHSIDGLLVTKGVKVTNVRRLPKNTSDHHPVVATVHFD